MSGPNEPRIPAPLGQGVVNNAWKFISCPLELRLQTFFITGNGPDMILVDGCQLAVGRCQL